MAVALEVEVMETEEKVDGIVTTATADWASDLAPAVTVVVAAQGTRTTTLTCAAVETWTGNHETTIDGVAEATTTTTIDVAERHNHPQHQERTVVGTYKRKQGTAK